jgi:hypothetical protein
MENLFFPLFAAIQRDDIEKGRLVLNAEPHDRLDDRFRLVFGEIDITHWQALQTEAPKETLSDLAKRLDRLLYIVIGSLVLIALELWRK